jgi:Protein of unknown function (DUF1761)
MNKDNHLAIIVCVIVQLAFSFLWYSPQLFLNPWWAAFNRLGPIPAPTPGPFVIAIASSIVSCYVMSWLVRVTRSNTAGWGALLGFLVGIGFASTALLSTYAFAHIGRQAMWIDAAHSIISLAIIGAILGAWAPKRRR